MYNIMHKFFSKINKKIYFLWYYNNEHPIPENLIKNITDVVHYNPGYSYHIIDKNEMDNIVYTSLYKNYEHCIQKCDFARYYILYNYGGIYMDTDIKMTKSLNDLYIKYPYGKVFLCTECILTDDQVSRITQDNKIRNNIPEHNVRIANYFIISLHSYHPFWKEVFELLYERFHLQVTSDYDIIYTTGPDIITTAYHNYISKNVKPDNSVILLGIDECKEYFTHQALGSWRNKY